MVLRRSLKPEGHQGQDGNPNKDLVAERTAQASQGGEVWVRGRGRAATAEGAVPCSLLSAWKLPESPLDVAGMTQLPEIANAR